MGGLMTDEERDALLERLEATVNRMEPKVDGIVVYVKAMARKLLAPAEIAEIEAEVAATERATVG